MANVYYTVVPRAIVIPGEYSRLYNDSKSLLQKISYLSSASFERQPVPKEIVDLEHFLKSITRFIDHEEISPTMKWNAICKRTEIYFKDTPPFSTVGPHNPIVKHSLSKDLKDILFEIRQLLMMVTSMILDSEKEEREIAIQSSKQRVPIEVIDLMDLEEEEEEEEEEEQKETKSNDNNSSIVNCNNNNNKEELLLNHLRNQLDVIASKICVTETGYKIKELLVNDEVEETAVGGITARCSIVLGVRKKKMFVAKTEGKGRGRFRKKKAMSGIKKGNMFHRHIYHELSCKESCLCKEKFGVRHRKRTKGSDVDTWVSLALKFLDDQGLIPIRCEVPVKWDSVFVTEIDLLALCSKTNRVVNISWKTGYGAECMNKVNTFGNLIRDANVVSSIHETHQLQQQMENSMLERSSFSQLRVKDNFIVYLGYNGDSPIVHFKPSLWRGNVDIVHFVERIFFSDVV